VLLVWLFFFFSSRRRHTRFDCDWSSDVCSSDLELLPRLCSGEIELPDDRALIDQLAGLERRTRSGGKDVIDHPPGGHDDLANARSEERRVGKECRSRRARES